MLYFEMDIDAEVCSGLAQSFFFFLPLKAKISLTAPIPLRSTSPLFKCYWTTLSIPKVIATVTVEWTWKTGGTILTAENGSTPSKTHRSAISSTKNLTWILLGLNPSLHGDKPITAHLQYKMSILTSFWSAAACFNPASWLILHLSPPTNFVTLGNCLVGLVGPVSVGVDRYLK